MTGLRIRVLSNNKLEFIRAPTNGMVVVRGLLRSYTSHWCSLKSIEFLSCLSSCCLCAGFGRTGGMSVTLGKKTPSVDTF